MAKKKIIVAWRLNNVKQVFKNIKLQATCFFYKINVQIKYDSAKDNNFKKLGQKFCFFFFCNKYQK